MEVAPLTPMNIVPLLKTFSNPVVAVVALVQVIPSDERTIVETEFEPVPDTTHRDCFEFHVTEYADVTDKFVFATAVHVAPPSIDLAIPLPPVIIPTANQYDPFQSTS
jgi:hypothetical protein